MSRGSGGDTGNLHILFIRHGETQDNIDKVLQGWRDTSLTDKGVKESEVLASKLCDQQIDAIYHSPLIRIKQTIEPIISTHPDTKLYIDADLRGQNLGDLEGGSYDLVDFGNPRSADGKLGVESFDDFVRRLKRAFGRIVGAELPRCMKHTERFVAIATHGVAITALLKALENTPDCEGFNAKLAVRGPEAFEVRWPDSDDIAKLVVPRPETVPLEDGSLDWDALIGQPFVIEKWGKKEKAL